MSRARHVGRGGESWLRPLVIAPVWCLAVARMDLAKLILGYVHVFIWPAVLVVVVIRFRGAIGALMGRVASESQEFTASFFGIELAATFQEKAATLAERAETAENPELREEMREAARNLTLDAFRALAAQFDDAPLPVRREIVSELERAAAPLGWKDLLPLAYSPSVGERVGAAIGLRVQLRRVRRRHTRIPTCSPLSRNSSPIAIRESGIELLSCFGHSRSSFLCLRRTSGRSPSGTGTPL